MLPFEIGGKKIGVPYKWETRISRKSKNSFYQLIDQGLTGLIAFSVAPLRICLVSGLFIDRFIDLQTVARYTVRQRSVVIHGQIDRNKCCWT